MMHILLWGTPNSGKTWFRHALARSLLGIKYRLRETHLLTLINATSDLPVFFTPPRGLATNEIEQENWLFSWRVLNHRVPECIHSHTITISDVPGSLLMTLRTGEQDNAAYSLFMSATHLVIFVNLEHFLGDASRKPDKVAKELQETALANLAMLIQRKSEYVEVAVCFSKADILSIQERADGISEILRRPSLEQIACYLEALETTLGSQRINFHLISSFGFLEQEYIFANRGNDWLKNEQMWSPWNVHWPLLTFLERLEHSRLASVGNQLGRFLFRSVRSERHQRYSMYSQLKLLQGLQIK